MLTKSEVRSQKSEVVFETEIYAPSQKRLAARLSFAELPSKAGF